MYAASSIITREAPHPFVVFFKVSKHYKEGGGGEEEGGIKKKLSLVLVSQGED